MHPFIFLCQTVLFHYKEIFICKKIFMTKYEIVEQLAKDRKVEEFINNTAKTSRFDLDDLANDIYMSLLTKDDELIEGLYERGELDYWIAKMIWLNYFSNNSPYYTKYRKFQFQTCELTDKDFNRPEEVTWMLKK